MDSGGGGEKKKKAFVSQSTLCKALTASQSVFIRDVEFLILQFLTRLKQTLLLLIMVGISFWRCTENIHPFEYFL